MENSASPAEKLALLRHLLDEEEDIELLQKPISPREDRDDPPLSFAQGRLWFLEQLQPGKPTYNVADAFHLTGRLDLEALEQSLQGIIDRHETLRTTFGMVAEEPVQIVSPPKPFTLKVTDLGNLPESERETEAQRLGAEEAQRPFDLSHGPLLRAGLLRLAEQEHVLLLTMHHIVSDGWSMGIFFEELAALYEAHTASKPVSLPGLPIQYADYAIWKREWMRGEVLEEQLDYWSRQLEGAPEVLELPTDRPRPPVQSFRGAYQSFTLPAPLDAGLRELAGREDVTLFMVLLAAWKTLLYRYTGQEDALFGTPVAGRPRTETEGLIGFFANTLVLRTDLSGEPTFRELLGRVREVALGAHEHQDLPFEKLVEELDPDRDLSRNPLFQVMFAFQNAPMEVPRLSGLTVSTLEVDSRSSAFDLTLSMEETERGLIGMLEYSTDLFDAETIARMAEHLQVLLEGAVDHPEHPISALPLLTEDERQQLLVEWNQTQADYPRESSMHLLFEEQVERTPDAVAVVFEGQQLTYRELNARANQVGHHLRKLGVGPEVLVGICVERSLQMVVGLLGILKAGGAYVPLDPAYPKDRLSFMLEDARVPVLLTQKRHLPSLPEHSAKVVCLETGLEKISGESKENPVSDVTADNLAYVIYTSGSTGKPKGVLLEHGGLCNLAQAQGEAFDVRPDSRVLQFASLSFDGSTFEVLMALSSGATLCLERQESLLPGPALMGVLRERAITNVTLPPSALAVLPTEKLPALETIIVAGESCPAALVARWGTNHRFFNGYGPSEASVCATIARCVSSSRTPPIGRPITNKRVYVLDQRLQPVPIGVPGELHIGGVGLARGYLNRPELTTEKFIPDLFSEEPEDRLYKTGDLARYLPDGNIEFLGRIDHQVKIRGFRVELGEIEAVLRQHETVKEAVVLTREDVPGEKRLVAYLVPRRDQKLRVAGLRGFLKQKLPGYMVPPDFVEIGSMPLSPNGKIDRGALRALDQSRLESDGTYIAPRNTVEETLAGVWAEVLGLQQVGIYDDFFELGGHSLQLAQLVSRMSSEMDLDVSIKLVFTHPCVAALAEALGDTHEAPSLEARSEPASASTEPTREEPPQTSSPYTKIERRPLLSLFAAGRIAPVDAAALGYLPDSLPEDTGLSRAEIIDDWYEDLPGLESIMETDLGRIGILTLPRFDSGLYSDPEGLLAVVIEALEMSKRLGASTVSLTGILASATDYGRALVEATAGREDLPRVSTGHATTTATVVLTVGRILQAAGRDLTRERVAFLGLGSVGIAVLRLLLKALPHPAEIYLCDVYSKSEHLEEVQRELVDELGFRGVVRVASSGSWSGVSPVVYDASLIVGATNMPDILDIEQVEPGTMIVDDSGPHCFAPELAIKRFREQEDILFTEGGVLRSPEPVHALEYLPRSQEQVMGAARLRAILERDPFEITGCVLSSLLSSRFEHLKPTVGLIDADTSLRHYETLFRLGFQAADLNCDGYVLAEESVGNFRRRFGQ